MARLVQKFGGSSVKDSEHIQKVARIVANTYREGKELVVVVSAMGDRTDELISLASQISSNPDPRELDVLLATGEQVSISLLALALQNLGLKARSFTGPQAGILTDDTHSFARIKTVHPTRIEASLRAGEIAVVAGFQGMTRSSELTTLGRGGSDTTAVALAAALKAECCDIYTDVDGVYTTDPRAVAQARRLRAISYEEMLSLSSHGAQVLNARSVELAMKNKVAIRLRSTFAPQDTGTLVSTRELTPDYQICGVACDSARVYAQLSFDPDAKNEFEKLAQQTLIEQLDHIGVSKRNIQLRATETATVFTINCEKRILRSVNSLLDETRTKLPDGQLVVDSNAASISLVGKSIGSDRTLSADLLKTLDNANIAVSMLCSDELSISAIVPGQLKDRAIRAVHDRFCQETFNPEMQFANVRI